MDHYKVLGVQKNASKEEIKRAFRKLAMEFHPDKHSHSSNNLRNSATQKFKQLSEAYEVLIDDRKRADYNLKRNAHGTHQSRRYDHRYGGGGGGGGYGHSYSYSNTRSSGYGFSGARTSSGSDGFAKLEMFMHFLKKRRFAINASLLVLPCIMLGGAFIVDSCGEALWKMRNTGRSFEEAMDSIERAKADKDSSY